MLEAPGKYWLGNKPSRWFRNQTVWWGNPTRRLEASPRKPGPSAFLDPGSTRQLRPAPGARLPPDPRGSAAARWAAGVTRAPRNGRSRTREEGAPAARALPGPLRPEAVEGAARLRPRKSQVRRAGISIRGHPRSAAIPRPGGWPGRQGPRVAERGRGHPRFPVGGTQDPRRAARVPGRVEPSAPRLPQPRPRSAAEERGPPGKGRGRGRGSPSPRRPGVRGPRRGAGPSSLLEGVPRCARPRSRRRGAAGYGSPKGRPLAGRCACPGRSRLLHSERL